MKKAKRLLSQLLYPHWALALLLSSVSALGLAYVFINGLDEHPLAPGLYALSFYALCVLCARAIRLSGRARRALHRSARADRFLTDAGLRTRVGLYAGLFINLFYAVFKLAAGIIYASVWMGAVALYYMALSLIRFMILRADRYSARLTAEREHYGWRRYRLCGVLLLLLNATITGMVMQMVWQNRGYVYPGFIIYAAAAYTFYRLILAVVKVIKKPVDDPVLSAARGLDLSMALMALFALQTAMFASFGADMPAQLRQRMNALTGSAVCLAVLCIAAVMIIRATRIIRKEETDGQRI